jgi:deoxyribonuclease IV
VNYNRPFGIHLRLEESYSSTIEQAMKLNIQMCQIFFMPEDLDKHLKVTDEDREKFLSLRKSVPLVYGHGSYWINLSTGDHISNVASKETFKKEIVISRQLNIEHMVLHAGTAKGFTKHLDDPACRLEGINQMSKMLNEVIEEDIIPAKTDFIFLIENTVHGGKAVCSDFSDFQILLGQIKYKKHIGFCLDTSHAWAYGYDLAQTENFLETLDKTVGVDRIKLIHLNDSTKKCGSKIDQHAIPGHGKIGEKALKQLINHNALKHVPIIIEPPILSFKETQDMIEMVRELFFL